MSNFLVYGPIWIYFFSLTWKFDGDLKFSQMTLKPQKFVIMFRCKINFVIIWYSVIFAANLYLSICVWISFLWMFSFLFFFYKRRSFSRIRMSPCVNKSYMSNSVMIWYFIEESVCLFETCWFCGLFENEFWLIVMRKSRYSS